MTTDVIPRMARIAKILIDSALANHDIQNHLSDPRPPRIWTIDSVRRNPTVRMEWDHAIVIGGIGESLDAARHKNWGSSSVFFHSNQTTRYTGAGSSTSTRPPARTTAASSSGRP